MQRIMQCWILIGYFSNLGRIGTIWKRNGGRRNSTTGSGRKLE
ncbi:unnamed protein product [Onchocerca flexuosa]|uniref:Uncharacterized protein n=1 Tax=Onchocerca flexuosa TaxID=387005 RepID=A0A183HVT5_9BILA|nr:unnamed protein product [Onchocerca flexuosa]